MISGYARAGKDTAADFFSDRHGYRKFGFSDPLYEMLSPFLGMSVDALHQLKEEQAKQIAQGKKYTPAYDVRHLLKTLGTEWGRDCIGKDVWAEVLFSKWAIACARRHNSNFVIRDWRFESEGALLRDRIGAPHVFRVKVMRDNCAPQKDHRSEQEIEMLPCDWVVENNGTIRDMYQSLAEGYQLFRHGLI